MMRYTPVKSAPVAPSLAAASHIPLSQEGSTTYDVISEAEPPSRVTNDQQDPTSSPASQFPASFTPDSSQSGSSITCSSPRVEVAEGINEDSVKEAILAGVAGGVGEIYHSPLTDELFAASPAALALVECGLLARIAQMAVNMRALNEDLVAIRARREQLAASRVITGTSLSAC
ncbi:hypothetical protein PEX1_031640 [Penicillium expansum]|uniref:Uncharacterized protein n=1 Tax=Penicillium expansum TaxID=27334 RepID=A0A0A2JJD7_PENEN|nr:hypothetical protein PEX2_090210 [Penicillium expansum]KGO47527.1 hypothetical protein PEXP_014140 [Penicillium expansum]KGO50444.1 hypothetical protein PEX1_031640 [Penicillium expansum]KGO54768.1 hypothetical protein PEX2_090210 [Penicillium expansum]